MSNVLSFVYLTEECGDYRKENNTLQEDVINVKSRLPVGHVGFFAHNNNATVVSLIFSASFEIKFGLWCQFKDMSLK